MFGAALTTCTLACTGIQAMPSGQAIETELILTDEVESSVDRPCLEPTAAIDEVISITSGAVLCAGFLHVKDLGLGLARSLDLGSGNVDVRSFVDIGQSLCCIYPSIQELGGRSRWMEVSCVLESSLHRGRLGSLQYAW